MKRIKLSNGGFALIDEEMFDIINKYNWYKTNQNYAQSYIPDVHINKFGKKRYQKFISMHHVVIGHPINKLVTDHVNGNSLDNRRSNLRIVTNRQNGLNRKDGIKYSGTAKNGNGWAVRVWVDGERKYLGTYAIREDAARVYRNYVESLSTIPKESEVKE